MIERKSPNARWQSDLFRKAGLLPRDNPRSGRDDGWPWSGTDPLVQPLPADMSRQDGPLQLPFPGGPRPSM